MAGDRRLVVPVVAVAAVVVLVAAVVARSVLTGQQGGARQHQDGGHHDEAADHGEADEPAAADLLAEHQDPPQDRHDRVASVRPGWAARSRPAFMADWVRNMPSAPAAIIA